MLRLICLISFTVHRILLFLFFSEGYALLSIQDGPKVAY